MNLMNVDQLLKQQREYFRSGATLPVEFRISMLKKLYKTIKKYEYEIVEALNNDLGKSDYESYLCEIGLTLSEISYLLKHINRFVKEKTVWTSLGQFAARSYKKSVPYGNVLIMSPWNYPFLLTMEPLVDALAAGNTAIVKPSAYSSSTSEMIKTIITECFDEKYVAVVTGGRKENSELLDKKFDFVFFTGSLEVGKEVLRHTAETLTPAVLELGGKSPCIVDNTAKIPLAAKRIIFGKFINCGQTCVAPDYILCHQSVKDELIKEMKKQIQLQFGDDPLMNPDYGKIINEKHYERLCGLIDHHKVVHGGRCHKDTLQIEPTVMDNITWDDAVMKEEIFGPLLPVLTYNSLDDVICDLQHRSKPLALYLFAENHGVIKEVTNRCQYGGGCINDVVTHVATSHLPFGGVGESGMGYYHGKAGFDTFSHTKSILDKKTWIDLPMRYQPYNRGLFEKIVHFFLK